MNAIGFHNKYSNYKLKNNFGMLFAYKSNRKTKSIINIFLRIRG